MSDRGTASNLEGVSGAEHVAKMIAALGKLLEVRMSKSDEDVTFNEEIELIKSYIYIQNIRFNDQFLLEIAAAQHIGQLKVPKLILQPLVENAIIHGLKNIEDKGVITILAQRRDGYLKISVIDNGEGIPKAKIRQILDNTSREGYKQRFSGIGLHNVNERIKLRYGESYGISISSKVGYGTIVDLMLPIVE